MWQLVINGPGYFDTKYDLPEGTTHVGRADENDIVLSGDLVSRKHANFHVTGNALVFEDLGSRNGSRLNGDKVVGTSPMKPGDVVAVGENSLVVRQPTTAETAATEMVDAGGGGAVRRFGRGVDVSHAVLMARDIQDSIVRRVLDNSLPFEVDDHEPPPVPNKVKRRAASDTDENEAAEVRSDGPSYPVAFHSLVMLFRVAERLATAPTLQSFLDDTTDTVMKRVGASTGVVLVRHPTGVLVPAAVRHAKKLSKGEVPVSDAIVEAALAQGQAIAVADVRDDSRFAERDSVVLYGIDQVLCVPIGQKAPFDGVLYLNRTQVNDEPIEALLDVCTALAQLLQTAMHKFSARPPTGDRLRSALERFHGPDIVERRVGELAQKTVRLSQLEEKQVTVLFADIAGFTDLAFKLKPEQVADLLSEFYKVATPLIFSFEGTVDKFVGDSVMALFGAPYGKGDDAIRAVRSAMALKAEWERAMQKRPENERLLLKVGLTTGKVLAGSVGSEARLDYTAIGEPVNVASWLCQSAEAGQVLITGKTLAAVGARFDVTPLGERPLLGSRVRTAIFEVLDEDDDSGTLSGVR
ncbi:MAG: adenylate/guanylate cyclase domain-containing protein [Myxococcales bacterium]|nr:adenylate/guanylate cyclase domain-containing protein [Myxococcales bacterium]